MKSLLRSLFVVAALLVIVPAAQAQMDCFQCDPYYSWCNEPCIVCLTLSQDEGCLEWYESTCGEHSDGCLNCSPNYQETGRTNVGTYGESHWNWWDGFSCSHHSVDLVTETDSNHCNANSSYWTRTFCQDWEDGWKYQNGDYVDCCDGNPWPLFTCNHYHSCY